MAGQRRQEGGEACFPSDLVIPSVVGGNNDDCPRGKTNVGIENAATDLVAFGAEVGTPAACWKRLTSEAGGLLDVYRGDHDRRQEMARSPRRLSSTKA